MSSRDNDALVKKEIDTGWSFWKLTQAEFGRGMTSAAIGRTGESEEMERGPLVNLCELDQNIFFFSPVLECFFSSTRVFFLKKRRKKVKKDSLNLSSSSLFRSTSTFILKSFLSLRFFFFFFPDITACQDYLFSRTCSVRNYLATIFNFASWVNLCKTCKLSSEYISEFQVGIGRTGSLDSW